MRDPCKRDLANLEPVAKGAVLAVELRGRDEGKSKKDEGRSPEIRDQRCGKNFLFKPQLESLTP
jgi:hypothetical protein